jgi:hypothetical protein
MSERAGHTPGAWFIDPDEGEFTVSTDHGQIICTCLSAEDFPCLEEGTESHMDDEARANARLIAAAPDLLAALKAWAELWDGELTPAPGSVHAEMLAAIAKAESHQP